MQVVALAAEDDFDGWRDAARALVGRRVPPGEIIWQVGDTETDLFATKHVVAGSNTMRVPRRFAELAHDAILHSEPQRFALLYTLLDRLVDNPHAVEDSADPLVQRLERMAKAVRRDIHKMRAFVRFREVVDDAGAHFIAWFEPEHHIARANARFFVDRFHTIRWSILTPDVSLHWDKMTLIQGPGASREDAPQDDPIEAVWKTYYAAIFNPARLKIGAMLKEMPRKYWKNMPETALVPGLIAGAQARESAMVTSARTKSRMEPGRKNQAAWHALRSEATACTRCHLHAHTTQMVFGEGPVDAPLMLVGEQPGDKEDVEGRPFVGPAGQLLNRALEAAGIDRTKAYLTNAGEITACRWWFEQESLLVRPRVTIALGATAARSLFGRAVVIDRERGRPLPLSGGEGEGWITVHPSYLLRLTDADRQAEEYAKFVADLRMAAARL